jgi:hypothetical protein
MPLAIANSTKQSLDFQFREPANNLERREHVPSGQQIVIGHSWSLEQTKKVISQLQRIGARDAAEIRGNNLGAFSGYSYRYDGVVTTEEIEIGHAAVVDTQTDRSIRQTTRSALGFDRTGRRPDRGRRVNATVSEVEVRQELGPYERPTGKEVNFKIAVDPEGRSDIDLPI